MGQQSRCFIFAAGSFYGLPPRPERRDFTIAADGGYRWCQQEQITPDLLIGDFDSLQVIPEDLPKRVYPVEKDDTDSMLAIKTGLSLGYREFHLYGCTGGRLDHTIANLQCLCFLANQGAKGYLYSEKEILTAITNGQHRLPARQDGTFSVFCLGSDAEGVCIEGAKYSLHGATLGASFPLGVSNRFIGNPVRIQVQCGCLLISCEHET